MSNNLVFIRFISITDLVHFMGYFVVLIVSISSHISLLLLKL